MKKKFKKIIEIIFYALFSINSKRKIIKKLDKYNYVSFDIFDTLIKRNVKEPSDIFDLVEARYNKLNKVKINDFKRIRIKAEKEALKKSNYEEVTIDEIYSMISNYSADEKKRLIDLEFQIEMESCNVKEFGKVIFDYCIKNNKTIIITSDMYLPNSFIKKILDNNGYKGYKRIYLSSDERVTKRTGNIYIKLLKELKIKANEIIHIGDHPISDFINAKRNKINAILVRK